MAASYDMVLVRDISIFDVIEIVHQYMLDAGCHPVRRLEYESLDTFPQLDTNCVVFISPQADTGWRSIVAWPSELGISLEEWHSNNPLALWLSAKAHRALFLWTFRSSQAGYSVSLEGRVAEAMSVGDSAGLPAFFVSSLEQNLLGEILVDPAFNYQLFMATQSDGVEAGTALIAQRLNLGIHLTDIMDLIDGDGGLRYTDMGFEVVQPIGWTALVYQR